MTVINNVYENNDSEAKILIITDNISICKNFGKGGANKSEDRKKIITVITSITVIGFVTVAVITNDSTVIMLTTVLLSSIKQ